MRLGNCRWETIAQFIGSKRTAAEVLNMAKNQTDTSTLAAQAKPDIAASHHCRPATLQHCTMQDRNLASNPIRGDPTRRWPAVGPQGLVPHGSAARRSDLTRATRGCAAAAEARR
jgi:hypothetical protein